MSPEDQRYEQGSAALLAGGARAETAPVEGGGRWGPAAVLRPTGPVLEPLTELANSVGAAAGAGHWVHHPASLHFTLRALEPYRSSLPPTDPLRRAYAEALDAAAAGIPAARIELRGVCPHPAGVTVVGYPLDQTLATLQTRFAEELRARGAAGFESWVRDRWYVSLLHFAGPLADPASVVAWCDERRALPIGVVELDAVEIVRWHYTGTGVRLEALHHAGVGGQSSVWPMNSSVTSTGQRGLSTTSNSPQ